MMNTEQKIRKFFDDYTRRFNNNLAAGAAVDAKAVRDSFADYFVESSSNGVQGSRNNLLFGFVIPRGFRHYRRLGATGITLARLQLTRIDDHHYMAQAHWDAAYRRKNGTCSIGFDVVYFLTLHSGSPKIFSYITADEKKVLRAHGIV
jgi:hypothetical protein